MIKFFKEEDGIKFHSEDSTYWIKIEDVNKKLNEQMIKVWGSCHLDQWSMDSYADENGTDTHKSLMLPPVRIEKTDRCDHREFIRKYAICINYKFCPKCGREL